MNKKVLGLLLAGAILAVNTLAPAAEGLASGDSVLQGEIAEQVTANSEETDAYAGDETEVYAKGVPEGEIEVYTEDVPSEEKEVFSEDGEIELFANKTGSCGANLTYEISGDTLIISGTGAMTSYASTTAPWYSSKTTITTVVVREGVTSLSDKALYNMTNLTSVTLPSTLESIGNKAFYGCKMLPQLTIPEGVATIGDQAFYECSALTGITLPSTLASIGSEAFYKCSALTGVTLPSTLESIGNKAFYLCSALTGVTLPSTLKSIGSEAFYKCTSLQGIQIPDSVTSIGSDTFNGCSSLSSATLPSGITSIPVNMFSSCSALAEVTIPEGITAIGDSAFNGCSSLSSVTLPSTLKSIGSKTFYGCSKLNNVVLPSDLTAIGSYGFYNCSSLQAIKIPDGVTTAGEHTFERCSNLKSVKLPSGLTSIPNSMFYSCSALTDISVPEGVTDIGESVFYHCNSLSTVTLPKTLTGISNGAFNYTNVSKLYFTGKEGEWSAVTKGTGVETYLSRAVIRYNVFVDGDLRGFFRSDNTTLEIEGRGDTIGTLYQNNTDIKSVIIPSNVTTISENAFSGCDNLSKVYFIGNDTAWNGIQTGSGNDAIENAQVYTSVLFSGNAIYNYTDTNSTRLLINGNGTMEDYTVSYGSNNSPWSNNASLISVIFESGLTKLGNNTFTGCTSLTSAVLSDTILSVGENAFSGCSQLASVTIPSSVTMVSANAFSGCANLKDVYFTGTRAQWQAMTKGTGNDALTNATVHYNVKTIGGFQWWMAEGDILEIAGSGALPDFTSGEPSPWKDNEDIKGVILPASISGIGANAFDGCTNLTKVYYKADKESWGDVEVTAEGNSAITSAAMYYDVQRESNILWTYDTERKNNILTISGSGAVASYTDTEKAPWLQYASDIKKIVIEDTITSIGDNSFKGCSAATEISISANTTDIGASAFEGCIKATDVAIPASVSFIDANAFKGCSALKSIVIPDSITEINASIFEGCSAATSVTIPASVEIINENAFKGCSALKSIEIPSGVTNICASAFEGCGAATSVSIPDSVTDIEENAFKNCSALKSIEIPESITEINASVFEGCSALNSVTIPASVEIINANAFKACAALKYMIIPTSVTEIGDSVLDGCTAFTDIYYFGSESEWQSIRKGDNNLTLSSANIHYECMTEGDIIYIFDENTGILELLTGSAIPAYAADNLPSWSGEKVISVIIPDSIKSIGDNAFLGCPNLENVYYTSSKTDWHNLPVSNEGNTTIKNASAYCDIHRENDIIWSFDTDTRMLTIGGSGNIANYSDSELPPWNQYRYSVEAVDIKKGVTSIGSYAFYQSPYLAAISIPDTIKTVGSYSFFGCSALREAKLPAAVTEIGNCAFSGCSSLTAIAIPDAVISIGNEAFRDCKLIKAVNIPANVQTIGTLALEGCYNLETITVADGNISFAAENNVLFDKGKTKLIKYAGKKAVRVYEIPNSVTTISSKAFSSAPKLGAVVIPTRVRTIEEDAFYRCVSLTDVYYNGTESEWNTVTISATNSLLYSDKVTIHYGEEAPASVEPTATAVEMLEGYSSDFNSAYVEHGGNYATLVLEPKVRIYGISSYNEYIAYRGQNGELIALDKVNAVYDEDTNQYLFFGELKYDSYDILLWYGNDMIPAAKKFTETKE